MKMKYSCKSLSVLTAIFQVDQNVSILDFIGAKDDGGGSKAKQWSNHHHHNTQLLTGLLPNQQL